MEIKKLSILKYNYVLYYKNEYFFISRAKYIKDVKKIATFSEYAPILYSIFIKKKVRKRLFKIYENVVLKKVVFIQHFYFDSILMLKKIGQNYIIV